MRRPRAGAHASRALVLRYLWGGCRTLPRFGIPQSYRQDRSVAGLALSECRTSRVMFRRKAKGVYVPVTKASPRVVRE
jgi:hypothetical protein